MKIPVTKQKPAINWFMLILALTVAVNALAQIVLMILVGPETRFVIGFALSFIGLMLYGFRFFVEDKRIVYFKKYTDYVEVKEFKKLQSKQELYNTFITQDGHILE
jgi:hypothetical protein